VIDGLILTDHDLTELAPDALAELLHRATSLASARPTTITS
jgi:hypothetical protein